MDEGKDRDGWKEEGTLKVDSHPDVRNPEKYLDCRTDLIGGGGNTDVCPGGKHPRAATEMTTNRELVRHKHNTAGVKISPGKSPR